MQNNNMQPNSEITTFFNAIIATIRNIFNTLLLPFTRFTYGSEISNFFLEFICKNKQLLLTTVSLAISMKSVQNMLHCTLITILLCICLVLYQALLGCAFVCIT
jgi:hypothetical protein